MTMINISNDPGVLPKPVCGWLGGIHPGRYSRFVYLRLPLNHRLSLFLILHLCLHLCLRM